MLTPLLRLVPEYDAARLDLVDDVDVDCTGSTSPERMPTYASLTEEYTLVMLIFVVEFDEIKCDCISTAHNPDSGD